MNFIPALRLITIKEQIIPAFYALQAKNYAAPVKGGATKLKTKKISNQKIVLPVEKDVKRLLTYCCGTNLLAEGGEDVKLKPDSEYPDWLWKINTDEIPVLEDLDPNTKKYWRFLRKNALKANNRLAATKKF